MELRSIRNAAVLVLFCGAIASAAGSIVLHGPVWAHFRPGPSSTSHSSKRPAAAPYRHTVAKTPAPRFLAQRSWQGENSHSFHAVGRWLPQRSWQAWRRPAVREAIGRYWLGQKYGLFQLAHRASWHPSIGRHLGKWQDFLKGHPKLGRLLLRHPHFDWWKWHHPHRPDPHVSPCRPGHPKHGRRPWWW